MDRTYPNMTSSAKLKVSTFYRIVFIDLEVIDNLLGQVQDCWFVIFPIFEDKISVDPAKYSGNPYSRNFKNIPSSSSIPTAKYFVSTFFFACATACSVLLRQYGA